MTKQRVIRPAGNLETKTPILPMPSFSNRSSSNDVAESSFEKESVSELDQSSKHDSQQMDYRQTKHIALHLIDPNPLAPREVYTPEMILERAENLRSQGQHDPIHVCPHPERPGRYIICDGWTRVLACLEHKVFDSLLAEIHSELTNTESAWFGYEQNEGRQQHCDLDRAMFYEKLISAGEPPSEVCRRAKLSKTLMSFYRAYAKLPESVMEIIRQHPNKFGATAAYQLFKLYDKCGERKTVSLAGKFAAEDHPVRWLTNQVQASLIPSNSKAKVPSKQVRYSNGVYKQRGDSFELTITVDAEHRETFAQALEQLLDTVAIHQPEEPTQTSNGDHDHV